MKASYANFEVHPQLEKCLCALTKDELAKLEDSILQYDILQPLIVCSINGLPGLYLLDGHNRYKIAKKHGLGYTVEADRPPLHFESVESACSWIIDNQLARRNLTKEQYMLLIGKRYNSTKQKQGGTGAHRHQKLQKYQNDTSVDSADKATEIAKKQGVSPITVKRAGDRAKKLEKTGLDELVQDGTIKSIEGAALDEIVQRVEQTPENKQQIINEVAEEAKANKGRVTPAQPKRPRSQKAALSIAPATAMPELTGGTSPKPSRISHVDDIPPEDTDERDTYEIALSQLRHQIFCCRSRLTPSQVETLKQKNLEFYICDFDVVAFEEENS